ncbi:glycoside hydrolase family 32 protein [Salinimicrobium sp. MT39]|uniref:Glycoside hydrolase family 32 protein n=1 Tax=Salinimicrobium profundisediminis TaxID=2994553 RepID=A0A9X3CYB9_9FLAO|nr:glycoside hydrolase family 32 protein [Salinimicrobium profundisediminis]MCX2839053.1 glycoside hydrolase family 32 protein [Salinimicrobium profundisediminis]
MFSKNKYLLIVLSLIILGCTKEDEENEPSVIKVGDNNFRPAYHFTPEKNWMNDPNGMVYYKGEYHLFFQYNPDDNVWGPMHWGHAVSEDLVNWEELPVALYPDDLGNIFSGSAIVDTHNTAGFKTGDEDVLAAIFTHHNPETNEQYQSLAYSNDKGRSWQKYEGNPVLTNEDKTDFRDPKVIWHEEKQQWIMVVAAGQEIIFYSSPNLKEWEYLQSFGHGHGAHGGVWECPDLFTVRNENGEERWALLVSINPGAPNGGSGTQYFLGSFDGETFETSQTETKWLDYGTDNYAGVTWSNEPNGRNLFIGWMSNWAYAQNVPTTAWRSAMTLPRTLELSNNGDLLLSKPAEEMSSVLASNSVEYTTNGVDIKNDPVLKTGTFQINTTLDLSKDKSIELFWGNETSGVSLQYDKTTSEFVINRNDAGYSFNNLNNNNLFIPYVLPESNELELEIWVDKSSVEIFVNGGERVITFLIFPNTPFGDLQIHSDSEAEFIQSLYIQPIVNK